MDIPQSDIRSCVLIRGTRSSTTKEMVNSYCETYGQVNYCRIAINPQGIMRGYNVVYKQEHSVNRFMDDRPHRIDGQSVKVRRCIPSDEEWRLTSEILITSSDDSTDNQVPNEDSLRDYFSKYGAIRTCRSDTYYNRPCAHLTFADYDRVDQLINDKPHTINKMLINVRKYITHDDDNKLQPSSSSSKQSSKFDTKRRQQSSTDSEQRRNKKSRSSTALSSKITIKQERCKDTDITRLKTANNLLIREVQSLISPPIQSIERINNDELLRLQADYERLNTQTKNLCHEQNNESYDPNTNEVLNKLHDDVTNLLQQIKNLQQEKKTFVDELFEKYTIEYILSLNDDDINQRLEQLEKENQLLLLIRQKAIMQTAFNKTSYDLRAKPIQTFCNIPKLGKHEHKKTFKIIGNNESQFLLDDKPAFHFEHIWGEGTNGEIYDRFARPAIADLVRGRSTLLFVTGRNKKYRNDILFGETKDTGLISLTINALYNSIGEHRALKYYFRPMGNNSYKVQSDAQAMFDRHQRDLLPKVSKNIIGNITHTSILEKSILDQTSNVSGIDDDYVYTIFVSAMEINSTQSHSVTSDLLKMFTEGINHTPLETPQTCMEIEFDDARKTRRKLFDTTKIPAKENSTRLYTIRLVQARKSEHTENITPIVSQLTFIDLATSKNAADLKAVKDFIVPPKKHSIDSSNHLQDFLNQFPIQDHQQLFVPIKLLLCASASNNDAEDTLYDIKWLMSLQANQYLVYLGRDEEKLVTRDDDHHRPPRPPPIHYSTSLQRTDHTNLAQHVPSSTPLAQSTPRSVTQIPTSTTTLASVNTQHSRQSQYQTINTTPNRSFNYIPNTIQSIPPSRPLSSSRLVMSNRSEETPTFITYPLTPNTGSSHLTQKVPPRIPPRIHRTPKPSPTTIEQEVPVSAETRLSSSIQNRRPPPPPPPPHAPSTLTTELNKLNKTRFSRKYSRTNLTNDVQQRASSAIATRTIPTPISTAKRVPLKEEHLLKRSSSADRVGRERWLHHITDSSTINNTIKLRTSLPNPLQLVSNHFNSMSKLLSATKYAIEHRAEDSVQLFQGDVMATSKGGVKVVFTSVDQVTHNSLLPSTCENSVLGSSIISI
ncbi:unnamed protein product [Adineta steineri]|uniref:RRM domain-containing protein n=1 Tax=Adineta steineri TaxID=433720 RepID=A0A819JNJ0_9BILA|nr:unnamed protein product [Adineta steineri]